MAAFLFNIDAKPTKMSTTISEVIEVLETWAPPSYQESYDNARLICGNPAEAVNKTLCCLDCTEDVVDEAIDLGANLIVAHHPIVFSGLKSLTGKNYIERTVIKAIKNDIAIYAIHTNLDSVATGVNWKICEKLGLSDVEILQPKSKLISKLVTYIPSAESEKVLDALFAAGAGKIGEYDECAFRLEGLGSFRASENTNPHVGEKGKRHFEPETRVELVLESHKEQAVLRALFAAHPYEEVAYQLTRLENPNQTVGFGMVGNLENPEGTLEFLHRVKQIFKTGAVRHTALCKEKISRVAVCGGSASFLLGNAIAQKADVFITADFKYHQFFDAEQKLIIADIGHYESEQFTIDLMADFIQMNFPNFASLKTSINTNPVHYL